MPEIGPLPEPLKSIPVDKTKHWTVWDQTKAEFKASGKTGIIILVEPDDAYHEKLTAWLAKYDSKLDMTKPDMKPYLVIEHATQAKDLYDEVIAAGLTAEFIISSSENAIPAKYFIVLGVSHKIQGDKAFVGAIDDPDYPLVLRQTISNHAVDFVGEECAANTTIAEGVSDDLLGSGHYLNVDPLVSEREEFGIGETYYPPSVGELPLHRWIVVNNEKREQVWVDRIVERTTKTGLLICGFYHAFSVAAKLSNRGFEVEVYTYTPWSKLNAQVS